MLPLRAGDETLRASVNCTAFRRDTRSVRQSMKSRKTAVEAPFHSVFMCAHPRPPPPILFEAAREALRQRMAGAHVLTRDRLAARSSRTAVCKLD